MGSPSLMKNSIVGWCLEKALGTLGSLQAKQGTQ